MIQHAGFGIEAFIFPTLGLISIGIGIGYFIYVVRIRNSWTMIKGVVLEYKSEYKKDNDGGRSWMHTPVIGYEINGEGFQSHGNFWNNRKTYKIGQEVNIFYNPKNHNKIYVDSRSNVYSFCAIFIGIGAIFFYMGMDFMLRFLGYK